MLYIYIYIYYIHITHKCALSLGDHLRAVADMFHP